MDALPQSCPPQEQQSFQLHLKVSVDLPPEAAVHTCHTTPAQVMPSVSTPTRTAPRPSTPQRAAAAPLRRPAMGLITLVISLNINPQASLDAGEPSVRARPADFCLLPFWPRGSQRWWQRSHQGAWIDCCGPRSQHRRGELAAETTEDLPWRRHIASTHFKTAMCVSGANRQWLDLVPSAAAHPPGARATGKDVPALTTARQCICM